MSLNDACLQPDYCCVMMNGKLHLKQSHVYYHQVQLQLYVASDLCSWCDFVVYTTKRHRCGENLSRCKLDIHVLSPIRLLLL